MGWLADARGCLAEDRSWAVCVGVEDRGREDASAGGRGRRASLFDGDPVEGGDQSEDRPVELGPVVGEDAGKRKVGFC